MSPSWSQLILSMMKPTNECHQNISQNLDIIKKYIFCDIRRIKYDVNIIYITFFEILHPPPKGVKVEIYEHKLLNLSFRPHVCAAHDVPQIWTLPQIDSTVDPLCCRKILLGRAFTWYEVEVHDDFTCHCIIPVQCSVQCDKWQYVRHRWKPDKWNMKEYCRFAEENEKEKIAPRCLSHLSPWMKIYWSTTDDFV